MEKLYIICIEDQREVLNAITNDLSIYEDYLVVEECESTAEAKDLMNEIDAEGDYITLLVSDHVMPHQTGVDFLIEVKKDSRFKDTKKILLTGQATHIDTIQAINQAGIDNYIEKPWKANDLHQKVSALLTEFIIEKGINYESYAPILDKQKLFELLKSI
jgi:two-component system chemotaxis response regulator CheY